MGVTAWRFARQHNLVVDNPAQGGFVLDRERARAVFIKQLGPLWTGPEALPEYARALLAVFCLRIQGAKDQAMNLLAELARSAAADRQGCPNPRAALDRLDEALQSPRVRVRLDAHAYTYPLFMTLLEAARADGILPSADFLWLKPLDRRLWYTLNNVVLLPALEKSPTELANLGKIILASLKNMMATGLGARLEGAYQQVVKSKPTNSPTPVLCAMDEVGYYAVPGLDVMAAQARSLGFWLLFAGQDIPALEKAGKEQAASIGANTNIKGCGKLEDAERTWQFFKENAGETHVTHVSEFSAGSAELTNTYSDMANAAVEKRTRIDLRDLKEQREGEFHLFFKSRIVRARMFYAAPEEPKELRLNHFIKMQPPSDEALAALVGLPETAEAIAEAVQQMTAGAESPVIADLAASWQRFACAPSPVERGMATFMEYAQARRRQAQATLAAMNRLGDAFLEKLNGITGPEPAADNAAAEEPKSTAQEPASEEQSAGLGPDIEEDDLPPGVRNQNGAAVASASKADEDSAGSGVESTDAKGDGDEAGKSEAGATGSAGPDQAAAPASGSDAPAASGTLSLASRLAQSSAVLSVARALSQGATVDSAVRAVGPAGPPVKGELLNQMAEIERLAGNASGARVTAEGAYATVEAVLASARRPKIKAPPELVRLLEELDAGLSRSSEASSEGTNT